MEKRVYCLIAPRRKCIKYVPEKDVPEVDTLRDSLNKACKTDSILNLMLCDKVTVFQYKDATGQWCDIEEDQVLKNNCEVNVLLIDLSTPKNISSVPTTSSFNPSILKNGESIDISVDVLEDVLYAEKPENVEEKCQLLSRDVGIINNNEVDDAEQIHEKENDAEDRDQQIITKTLKKNGCLLIKSKAANLSVLPQLSFDLQAHIEEVGIELSQQRLIRFYGQYLWQETAGSPSKQDYYNFASTIVATYPDLQGGANGNGIVRTQLSTWIRNHRANNKRAGSAKKRNHLGNEISFAPHDQATIISNKPTKVDKVTVADVEKALTEINKYADGKNVNHTKKLLSMTKTLRRLWIETEADRAVDIVEKYPPLKNHEMILYECISIVLSTDEDSVFSEINKTFQELHLFFSHEKSISVDIKTITEKDKVLVIQQLCTELLSKKSKKKQLDSLWTVNEVLCNPSCLSSCEGSAPRAVIFLDAEESVIHQAFIVADDKINIDIPDPTATKILATLLSCYYAWHRTFPSAYANILEFLAFKIFKIESKNNITIAKFIRKISNYESSTM